MAESVKNDGIHETYATQLSDGRIGTYAERLSDNYIEETYSEWMGSGDLLPYNEAVHT
jgi:hypothetical protein